MREGRRQPVARPFHYCSDGLENLAELDKRNPFPLWLLKPPAYAFSFPFTPRCPGSHPGQLRPAPLAVPLGGAVERAALPALERLGHPGLADGGYGLNRRLLRAPYAGRGHPRVAGAAGGHWLLIGN